LGKYTRDMGDLLVMSDEARFAWRPWDNRWQCQSRLHDFPHLGRTRGLGGVLRKLAGRRGEDSVLLSRLLRDPLNTLTHSEKQTVTLRCRAAGSTRHRLYELVVELLYEGSRPLITGRLQDVSHQEIDHLTGLRYLPDLRDEVAAWIAAAELHGRLCGLIIMDADRFREINAISHDLGDEVLRVSGVILRSSARREALPVRMYKGDEFAILVTVNSVEIFEQLVAGMRELMVGIRITPPPEIAELLSEPVITVSFTLAGGIAQPDEPAAAFIRRVDRDMMAAKKP
jgi:diguanylate cyclase (GGDEF)-like protein